MLEVKLECDRVTERLFIPPPHNNIVGGIRSAPKQAKRQRKQRKKN